MLLLTDLIPVHLLYCGQTVMIGCNHTSFEWTRAVCHIYGIIRHMQGLYCIALGCYQLFSNVTHRIPSYNEYNFFMAALHCSHAVVAGQSGHAKEV